jgi:SAM-dependent methyltransferase
MKHRRCMTMIMSSLLPALMAILPARQAAQAPRQLAEPGEKRANEVQPPDLVMDILGVRPGFVIGEVGAGHGRVTVYLAARVGDKGKVYANDIDRASVEYLKARCERQGLTNIEVILSLPDDARFPKNSLDLVVMSYVYHHVDNPGPLLKSILSSLRPWGILAMAEPKPEHVEASAKRLTRESVGKEARAAGFTLDTVIEDRLQADNRETAKLMLATAEKVDAAKRNVTRVPLREGRTLHHDVHGRHGAGKVFLRAAPAGTGIIAGGPMRAIFEVMGVTNVLVFCDTGAGGGKLRIYNSSGATFYTPTVFIYATQDLGKR